MVFLKIMLKAETDCYLLQLKNLLFLVPLLSYLSTISLSFSLFPLPLPAHPPSHILEFLSANITLYLMGLTYVLLSEHIGLSNKKQPSVLPGPCIIETSEHFLVKCYAMRGKRFQYRLYSFSHLKQLGIDS